MCTSFPLYPCAHNIPACKISPLRQNKLPSYDLNQVNTKLMMALKRKTHVHLPRFQIETGHELVQPLQVSPSWESVAVTQCCVVGRGSQWKGEGSMGAPPLLFAMYRPKPLDSTPWGSGAPKAVAFASAARPSFLFLADLCIIGKV